PLFVKPCRAGSSFGVTKVDKAEDLETQQDRVAAAIATAGEQDWKVLVEQGIDGREIECSVLCPKAGDEPKASWPGEIVLDH
ncbi:ATP-grasp domain-containing protein, partial [Bifidobacterium breve]|uniref:ATP-grasp domain-containing protein n=1 Tax=Bifidobacterium breve TaxID=1685 RepID=UPI001D014481